jgi:hypothetical protein
MGSQVESLSGEPIALLLNYAVHSVVGGPANSLVTGDLAGTAERFVERQYQDKVVALWTMGPAGDQDPKFTRSLMAVEYPSACAVRMNCPWWWSTSIFFCSRAMAKSTVHVIPSVFRDLQTARSNSSRCTTMSRRSAR